MENKRHNILDDALIMPPEVLGGAEHSLRIGLMTNTVINAMPVILNNPSSIAVEKPKFDTSKLEGDLPILLHIMGHVTIAVLVVLDKSTGNIQCFPFSNTNEFKKWWAYEVAFDILPNNLIEIRPVHPLVEKFDPDENFMNHIEALATIVGSFLHHLQLGNITVTEKSEDLTKINKKRHLKGNTPIINDWYANYVQHPQPNPSEDPNL